jgi:hypothetical protein
LRQHRRRGRFALTAERLLRRWYDMLNGTRFAKIPRIVTTGASEFQSEGMNLAHSASSTASHKKEFR